VYADSAELDRERGCIDDQVANLPEECVGGVPSKETSRLVWVRVDYTEGVLVEVWRGSDDGLVGRISDQLGVVQINDGIGDKIRAVVSD
jgi:hypothetical protein